MDVHLDEDGNEVETNPNDASWRNWLRVSYDFQKNSRVGTWNQISSGIRVQLARYGRGAHGYAMRSFRRNVIHPSLIHRNGNPSGRSTGRTNLDYKDVLIYPAPDLSFVDYLADLRANGNLPVVTLRRHGIRCRYISNGFRSTIRSVINAVRGTHLSRRTLLLRNGERLTDTNFGLYGSDLCLLGVPTTAERFSVASKGDDFNEVSKFITEHVFVGAAALPPDMTDLINLLKGYDRNTDDGVTDPLIERHVATMSHTNRIQFMVNCFEKIEMIESNEDGSRYFAAIDLMTPKTNWKDRFSANPPPGVVIFHAVHSCFANGDQRCNYKDQNSDEQKIKMEVIKCIRHTATHLREHLVDSFSDVEIDTMMMAAFGDIVLEFEKCLAKMDLLDYVVTWKD